MHTTNRLIPTARIVIHCPHCKGRAIARSSLAISDLLREITYMCLNSLCGCTYVATLEPVRLLSPSAMPDPAVQLPLSKRAWAYKRKQAPSEQQDWLPFKRK